MLEVVILCYFMIIFYVIFCYFAISTDIGHCHTFTICCFLLLLIIRVSHDNCRCARLSWTLPRFTQQPGFAAAFP